MHNLNQIFQGSNVFTLETLCLPLRDTLGVRAVRLGETPD